MANKPTDEQQQAIDVANSGSSFKISAFAGTGKTSTLTFIGAELNKRPYRSKDCMYLAFNKAIADESQSKFTSNVKCRTFHSLAFRGTPNHITQKINNHRLLPHELQKMMSLRNWETRNKQGKFEKSSPYEQAMTLNRGLECFCRSSSTEISHRHIEASLPSWINRSEANELITYLTPKLQALWDMSISKNYDFRISHDVYLKYWSLTNPVIPTNTIFFDEAQDADPIMLNIIRRQQSQCIFTGDRFQAIYEWRGAKNAMEKLQLPEVKLTQSWRFGQSVADVANLILSKLFDEKTLIKGNPNINSSIAPIASPTAYIVRTNATALTLAIELINKGITPTLVIDYQSISQQVREIQELMNGTITESRRSCVYGFQSWGDVQEYVEHSANSDLTIIVNLIKKNTPDEILSVLNHLMKQSHSNLSQITITTAHKSKGLEFKKVKVLGDFMWNEEGEKDKPLIEDAEGRLLYVACTRAIDQMDITELHPLFENINKIK